MSSRQRVSVNVEGIMYDTRDGDLLFDLAPKRKVLVLVLAEDMTIDGAMLLADRIRERFPGCLMEFPDDDPPGDEEPDCLPGAQAA